jgi:hypothetical protein
VEPDFLPDFDFYLGIELLQAVVVNLDDAFDVVLKGLGYVDVVVRAQSLSCL